MCETEKAKVRGCAEKRRLRRVDFPVPEGPDRTSGRGTRLGGWPLADVGGEEEDEEEEFFPVDVGCVGRVVSGGIEVERRR